MNPDTLRALLAKLLPLDEFEYERAELWSEGNACAAAWEAERKDAAAEYRALAEGAVRTIEGNATLRKHLEEACRMAIMVREELVFGGNWTDAQAAIDRFLASASLAAGESET